MKRQEKYLPKILRAAGLGIAVANLSAETLVWDANPESDIAGYRVFYGAANTSPIMIDVGNVTSRQFQDLVAGRTYFFYLTAYNTANVESEPSETLTYTKPSGSNQPPGVQITSPANGSSYETPATITINANASDPDGSVARVEFYNGANLLGSDTASPFSFTMDNVGQGTLSLQARAVDNGGASATSTIVNVTVAAAPPAISSIPDQSIPEDSQTRTVNFTISDSDTAVSSLTVSASSANTALIVNSSLALGGSGMNRTLSFRPQPDQSGSSVITVTVNDGQASASTSFTVTVNAINDTPTLTSVPDQNIEMNSSTVPLPITISDTETAPGSLTLTAESSNPALIPQSGLILSGSGGNRTITVTPAANTVGEAVITMRVTDGASSTSDTFIVRVSAPEGWVALAAEWLNWPMESQAGMFTVEFDAIPSSSPMNSVIGFSDGAGSQYSDLAAMVRFNPSGYIDAYNRTAFAAEAPIPYSANVRYHFRVAVNMLTRSYSVYVTLAAGPERTVANNFQFQVGQRPVIRLNNIAGRAESGGMVQLSPVKVQRNLNLLGTTEPLFGFTQLSLEAGSLYLEENFEGPGYENENWFELNDPNQTFGTTQMEGNFALNTRAGSQAYYEVGGAKELSTSFMLMWQERPLLHTIVDLSDMSGEPSGFLWYSNGELRISHGTAGASVKLDAAVGVPHHFWIEGKGATDGNNGEMQFYVSITEIKPLTPVARISAGSGTTVERVHFGGAAPDSPALLLDQVRISEDLITGSSEL